MMEDSLGAASAFGDGRLRTYDTTTRVRDLGILGLGLGALVEWRLGGTGQTGTGRGEREDFSKQLRKERRERE